MCRRCCRMLCSSSGMWSKSLTVPRGRGGRNTDLQGFLPGQSSTAPQFCKKRISARIVEQIVDTPVSRGGLQGFRPGQSSSSSSHRPAGFSEDLDEPGEGFFSHFSPWEKVRVPPRVRVRSCPGRSAHGLRRLTVLWTPLHAALCCCRVRLHRL